MGCWRKGKDQEDDQQQRGLLYFAWGKVLLEIAVRWFYRAIERERERELHEDIDLGKCSVAAGEKSKMTQKRKLKRLVIRLTLF